MLTLLTGMPFVQLGEGTMRALAFLPVGKFKTDKYGTMDLSAAKVGDPIIAAFDAGVPGTGVFVDIDHDFGKARGWVKSLGYGTYADKAGNEQQCMVAQVEYTTQGSQMLADGEYKGVSAAFGPMIDPATGKKWPMVLKAISLTNCPVMSMLPEPLNASVKMLADGDESELVTLADTVPMKKEADGDHPASDYAYVPNPKVPGSWKLRIDDVAHVGAAIAALTVGSRGTTVVIPDAERAAVVETVRAAWAKLHPDMKPDECPLAADGTHMTDTDALMVLLAETAGVPVDAPAPAVPPVDPTLALRRFAESHGLIFADTPSTDDHLGAFDALMDTLAESVKGANGVRDFRSFAKATRTKLEAILAPKGGKQMADDNNDVKLAEDRAVAAETKLAAIEASQSEEAITAALDKLSEKGMDEASRVLLKSIVTADGDVTLSDKSTVSVTDALAVFAEGLTIVPVTKEFSTQEKPADDKDTDPTDADLAVGKQLGNTLEQIKAAKATKEG